jgi:hypothetical protein
MTEHVWRAPGFTENVSGPREFHYLAEVDMLGWKFVRGTDGALLIETPRATSETVGQSMIAVLRPDLLEVIRAVLDLAVPQPDGAVPSDWNAVGRFA